MIEKGHWAYTNGYRVISHCLAIFKIVEKVLLTFNFAISIDNLLKTSLGG
jgi:hypothetical protein